MTSQELITSVTSDLNNLKQMDANESSFNFSFNFQSESNSPTNPNDKETPSNSESNKEPGTSTQSADSDEIKSKIEVYMNALVHSTNCTQETCTFTKCHQFKRVTIHNKNCKKFINDRCEFCRQLIAISVYHARNCTNYADCLVPFCQTIKQKFELKKSIEFVTTYLNVLRHCGRACKSVQTNLNIENENNKRKRSVESSDMCATDLTGTDFDDSFTAKNSEMKLKGDMFYEKLLQIKENLQLNESKDVTTIQLKLNKQSREKIFATFFQQILTNNPQLRKSRTPNDKNYANLIVKLLREEAASSQSTDGYLYLMTEMFYKLEKQLEKYRKMSGQCVACQTEPDELDQANPNADKDCDELPNKRMKTE